MKTKVYKGKGKTKEKKDPPLKPLIPEMYPETRGYDQFLEAIINRLEGAGL